ncbi:MAG: PaaI family thioesterase [Rhodobacter sp.]|nr:PaaI family thioesterase [Rhodobacter sp.]
MPPFIAQSPDQLPGPDRILSMSGLDFMRGILDGTVSGPPIGELMNYQLDQVEEGRVVFRGAPDFATMNPMGTVHGGWYGTLLDSCMGCAIMTTVPKGSLYTTLEYKVNINRTVPVGTKVLAIGVVQHAGRTTGVASGEIRGAQDGRLYATGSTTCMVFTPNPA